MDGPIVNCAIGVISPVRHRSDAGRLGTAAGLASALAVEGASCPIWRRRSFADRKRSRLIAQRTEHMRSS